MVICSPPSVWRLENDMQKSLLLLHSVEAVVRTQVVKLVACGFAHLGTSLSSQVWCFCFVFKFIYLFIYTQYFISLHPFFCPLVGCKYLHLTRLLVLTLSATCWVFQSAVTLSPFLWALHSLSNSVRPWDHPLC